LRILWVSHVIPYPPKAGVLLRSYHLLRGVARHHDVDLFAFIQESWLQTFYTDRQQGLDDCRTELLRFCKTVHLIPIERLARIGGQLRTAIEAAFEPECYIEGWLRSAAADRKLRALARDTSYSLIHFDTIALARYRKLFAGVPATLGHHNVESQMLERRADNESRGLKRWYFRRESRRLRNYERRVASDFAAHIVCSDLDAARLSTIAPEANIAIVPNGVDCDYFRPMDLPERAQSLIFVGTMNWYPNVDAVLFLLRDIWPAIRQQRPNATLDIVGANAPDSVHSLAARSPGVTVHGFVPEVRPLMDSAALYVCPIRDGGGTKLKILDACAMAKCVVAHPIACEGLNLLPAVEVALAETADHMAREIVRLLDDAPARRRMGSAARTLVRAKYSFDVIADSLSDLFQTLAPSGCVDA
jgi:sugar transferase (PEP-CTERM/EpsH1 system associated)